MTHNLKKFIGLTVLINLVLIFIPRLVDLLPENYQNFASFIVIVFDLWVVFDLITRLIYKMAGISRSDGRRKKLTHQEADTVNRYWMAWLSTSLVTVVAYVLLFDRNWRTSLYILIAGLAVILLVGINYKYKIMGHTKKELFK
jgi:magnesium-transporting ATPase (P-type)